MDLPGWQAIYEELGDQGLEIISVAQDTGGEAAAGEWFDRANATFTQIIDENHTISTLFNMVNVPTGVWIDEEGRIVRPNEVAYSKDISFLSMSVRGSEYVAALTDWVEKGAESEFAMTPEEVTGKIAPMSDDRAKADVYFKLANHFHFAEKEELANKYWAEAQKLEPDSWNYHRQDWSFTPGEAGANWMKKFRGLGDEPYYAPLELEKED